MAIHSTFDSNLLIFLFISSLPLKKENKTHPKSYSLVSHATEIKKAKQTCGISVAASVGVLGVV